MQAGGATNVFASSKFGGRMVYPDMQVRAPAGTCQDCASQEWARSNYFARVGSTFTSSKFGNGMVYADLPAHVKTAHALYSPLLK
jgi:hypothetical protein